MKCPKCNTFFSQNIPRCTICGYQLLRTEIQNNNLQQDINNQSITINEQYNYIQSNPLNRRSKIKRGIVGIILIFFVLSYYCIFINQPNENLTCPENYELKGKNCITVIEEALSVKKICNDGFQLLEDTCIKETIMEPITLNTCEAGYSINYTDNQCFKPIMQSAPIISYNCPESYTLDDSTCHKYNGLYMPRPVFVDQWWCNQGGYLIEGVGCVLSVSSISATPVYGKCPDSYDSSNDKLCTKNDIKPIIQRLTCAFNEYVIEDNNCVKTEYSTPDEKLTCDVDFIQVDNICKKEIIIEAIKKSKE